MKKLFARHYNPLFAPKGHYSEQNQVEKFLALESHPRQKERTLSTLSHLSATSSWII
mgnify:FL=1